MKKQSPKIYLIIIAILVASALIGFIGFATWDKFVNKNDGSSAEQASDLQRTNLPADWTDYKFSDSGISVKLPKDWSITEVKSSIASVRLFSLNYPNDNTRFMISLYDDLSKMPPKEGDQEIYYANDESFENYSRNMVELADLSIVDFEKTNIINGDAYFVSYKRINSETDYYIYSLYSRNLPVNKALIFQLNSGEKKPTNDQIETYKQIFSSIKYEA